MPAPYDYTIGQVANPAQSFLQGIQMGDILRKREEDQAAAIEAKRAAAQRQSFMSQLMAKASAGTIKPADYEQLTMLDPANYKAWSESIVRMNTAQKEAGFANISGVYSALAMGTPEGVEVARRDLQTQLQAAENSDPQKAQTIKATLAQLDDPFSRSQLLIQSGVTLNGLDPERFKKLTENVAAQRAAPFEQRKIEAGASEAESKAAKAKVDVGAAERAAPFEQRKIEAGASEAESKAAKAKVDVGTAESAAAKAKIEAQYVEREKVAELKKKAADLGLTQAQTSQSLASTSNLKEQGRLLRLDFDAALKGLPLPSKGGGQTTVGAATEDERKAAGWLAQATNAYTNMLKAMYTKEGKPTKAEAPGIMETIALEPLKGIVRSPERQQFVQATSSLSEALLRAATGAGVNKEEAAQKVAELTPVWSDDEATKKQKLDAIPMYLQSLQARAGRAAPKDYKVPTAQQRNVVVSY